MGIKINMKQLEIRRGRRAASLLAVLGAASVLAAGCGGNGAGDKAGPAGNGPVPPTVGPGGVQLSTGGAQGEAVSVRPGAAVTLTKAERAARKGESIKKAAGFDPQPNVAKVVAPKAAIKRTSQRAVQPVGTPEHQAPVHESQHKKTSGRIATAAKHAANSAANSPCKLVTRREASAILGRSVRQSLAPQGPTCIFASGRKALVTMSVQQVRFATILKTARVVSHQRVGDHTIYCLQAGARSTYVPLSSKGVLSITGGCTTGARFARKALSRV
jgi:hypothetical protein